MTTELWRHLVTWELRHTVRSAPFWVMAAIAFATPLVAALAILSNRGATSGSDLLSTVAAAEIVAISLLVCLWTVFAVKRQVAADVSDDWLLVLRYRQSLVSRYLAGWMVGVMLVGVSAVGDALVYGFEVHLTGPAPAEVAGSFVSMLPGAVWSLLGLQLVKLVALLQPLAMASIIIAAADFLVASTPVVLFVLVCLDLFWCALPLAGFAIPAAMLMQDPLRGIGLFMLFSAVFAGLIALAFGWYKAEDFWAFLKLALDKRKESLGAVRTAIGETVQQHTGLARAVNSRSRAFWSRHGLPPLLAHDLARFPWGPRRAGRNYFTWQVVAALAVLGVVSLYAGLVQNKPVGTYLFYFGWWMAALVLVVRTLVSGAQIVVQEREQGTLSCLVASPLGTRRVLTAKLVVVLIQAAPLLAVLVAAWLLNPSFGRVTADAFTLVCLTAVAAVCGTIASGLSAHRLTALLLGTVLFGVGWFACDWLGGQWYVLLSDVLEAPRSSLGFELGRFTVGIASLAAAGVAVWFAALPFLARRVESLASEV